MGDSLGFAIGNGVFVQELIGLLFIDDMRARDLAQFRTSCSAAREPPVARSIAHQRDLLIRVLARADIRSRLTLGA
jgi:hypothetical protein